MSEERWREVPGYEGVFSVSDEGRVRRELAYRNTFAGRIKTATIDRDGYPNVNLSRAGQSGRTFRVHRLVVEAFLGPIPRDRVVNHRNGERADNRLENLELLTMSENVLHGFRVNGRKRTGEKLTDAQAVEIRAKRTAGVSLQALAEEYGTVRQTIANVVQGKTWTTAGGEVMPARGWRRGNMLTAEKVLAIRT